MTPETPTPTREQHRALHYDLTEQLAALPSCGAMNAGRKPYRASRTEQAVKAREDDPWHWWLRHQDRVPADLRSAVGTRDGRPARPLDRDLVADESKITRRCSTTTRARPREPS